MGHFHSRKTNKRADNHFDADDRHRIFALGVLLNVAFVLAEVVFGILAGSMALLADAGHNLSDVLGLLLAWGADHLSRRRPTYRRTYGWKSSTIMAAMLNAIILLTAVGGIILESVHRLARPGPVAGKTVILVAAAGVLVNTATALLFMPERKRDLNIRGAFIHMAADALVSAGVVVSGFAVLATGWVWIDPVVGLMIAGIILLGTWGLLKESVNLATHSVPVGIDARAVTDYLAGLPGASAVYDVHIWAMSTHETALTAHIVKPDPKNDDSFLREVQSGLLELFGIDHVTIQLERSSASLQCGKTCATPGDRDGRP